MKIFTSIKNKEATMLGSRILLTLTIALAFFAGDALASICGGKEIWVKAPSDWTAPFYYYGGGGWGTITQANYRDGWYVVKLTGGPTHDETGGFAIGKENQHGTATQRWIGRTTYNVSGQTPADGATTRIDCSLFAGGDILYISEDPTTPNRTIIGTKPPNARYFYVLPPNDENWIVGIPYLKVGSKTAVPLGMDEHCGWFSKVYFGTDMPTEEDAWIWLGSKKTDVVGLLGMGEDPMDWPGDDPTPFNLKKQFDDLLGEDQPGKVYFFANEGTWQANLATVPEQKERCTYSFAAIIYDTDGTANTSFDSVQTNYRTSETATPATCGPYGCDGSGIAKKLVKDNLVLDAASGRMKMEFNDRSPNWNTGWTKANFDAAFRPTPTKNVVRCYDMPFKRNKDSQWEFNSNKLCSDGTLDLEGTCRVGSTNNSYAWGFFPPELSTSRGDGDYTQCPTCDRKRKAESWVPLNSAAISQFCYDRGRRGTSNGPNITNCGTEFVEGDFRNGDLPNVGTANSSASAWNWGPMPTPPFPNAERDKLVLPDRNELFCFESAPTEFEYTKGQEFFFSGDDDIWVFINNKLVIDLGGTHLAAPGYVNLDNLGLTEGTKYPINIFFCDRRITMSNVRISTNMYFSQKSGLSLKEETVQKLGDVCLETSGGGSCAAVASGAADTKPKCGAELRDQLQYYIQKRNGDNKQMLTATTPGCSQEGNILKCFNSITIDFSGGQVQVLSIAQGLVGTWVVYAELKDGPGIPDPKPRPLPLGSTSGRTSIQVAWGTIKNESNGQVITTLSDFTNGVGGKVGKRAVASKLIPVAFAEGGWVADSSTAGATFEVLETSKGSTVRIQETSKKDPNVTGSYLLAYRDPEGTQEVDLSRDQTIPDNGVLVLYFTGEFEAEGTATYNINSRADALGAPFALEVHQPKIEFVDASNEIIPQNQRIGSDPAKGNNATERWVYVGTTLNRRIAAFDPVDGGICTTCTFKPADIAVDPYVSRRGGATEKNKEAILFPERKLENGIGALSLYSTRRIQFDQDSSAYFTVGGPSIEQSTIARWDSLQFREPPVPYPVSSEIFDRNGDGKGDSIRIVYNREFPVDTLPNMIQIVWSLSDTVSFGQATRGADGRYTDAGIVPAQNREFWAPYLRKGANPKDGDTIVITVPYGDREDIQNQFNKDIKTAVHGVGEAVISWSTYQDDEGNTGVTSSFTSGITDRMPPIIISAEYQGGEGDCGTDAGRPCIDYVRVWLSEPVKSAEGANDEKSKEAFAYKLLIRGEDANFEVYRESKSLPTEMLWSKNDRWLPKEDSIVRLTYRRFKTENDNSYTPVPGDSIRLLDKQGGNPLEHAFIDLAGNHPNPEEWGRKIEGRGPWSVDKNLIANVDPTKADSILKQRIKDKFGSAVADKFTPDKPINLMPVLEGWKGDNLKDSLGYNYPSSVGPVFWPGARATVDELDTRLGRKIDRNKIWFVANSFYHTNLGNYTAKSGELRIKCTDPVFQIGGASDCTESENGLYLAWDLKDNKGRWVGTGAYVQVYNFYWEVVGEDPKVNGVVKKYPDDGNKIEMYGVRRAANKKK